MQRPARIVILAVALAGSAVAPAGASQIANHVRIAHLAWEDPRTPDDLRALLLRHFQAYLAGAAGPDIFTNLVGQYDALAHTPHYHRTGELLRQMFLIAYAQPDVRLRERYLAYALGWMTHYYVDIHEHRLVNRFGGYYKHDAARHKTLEMFETAHVLTRSEHPDTLPYVAPAAALPIALVNDALLRTFPRTLADRLFSWTGDAIRRNAREAAPAERQSDIQLAAYILEQFTIININQFRTQRPRLTIQEAAMGVIPFRFEYDRLISPLEVAVTKVAVSRDLRIGDPDAIAADVEWAVHDDGLTAAYVTDWYAANRAALAAIVDTLVDAHAGLWKTVVVLPDHDLDTGQLEREGDAAAIAASRAFKRASAAELQWTVTAADGSQVAQGAIPIELASVAIERETRYRRVRRGTERLSIPSNAAMFGSVRRRLTLRATLRLRNANPQLMPGRYASAFRFPQPTGPPVETRLPLEGTDDWRFEVPPVTNVAGAGAGGEAGPGGPCRSLPGAWVMGGPYNVGRPTRIVSQGARLRFVNETGDGVLGTCTSDGRITIAGWGGLTGRTTAGGRRIDWSNGTWWTRGAAGSVRGADAVPAGGGQAGDYVAWLHPADTTCCPADTKGEPNYAFHGTRSNRVRPGAIVLRRFTSQEEMTAWACAREVSPHYWANTYARIDGYHVTRLPCKPTRR